MVERYPYRAADGTGAARRGFAVTPSDAADLTAETRALYIGQGGDLALILSSGDAITLSGVISGSLLPLRATRVKATGTTAGQIVGLY